MADDNKVLASLYATGHWQPLYGEDAVCYFGSGGQGPDGATHCAYVSAKYGWEVTRLGRGGGTHTTGAGRVRDYNGSVETTRDLTGLWQAMRNVLARQYGKGQIGRAANAVTKFQPLYTL